MKDLCWASLVAQKVKNPPAMQKTSVPFLCGEDPLEKEMATHSSILAWRISWTEEPEGLQSMGSQRVRHNWRNLAHTQTRLEIKRCGEVSWKRKLGIGPENILPWSYSVHRRGLYVSSSWGWVKVQGSGKVQKLNPSLINKHFVQNWVGNQTENLYSNLFFFFFLFSLEHKTSRFHLGINFFVDV